jgi:site-specific DNA-methyltransferase (adenine-specific)
MREEEKVFYLGDWLEIAKSLEDNSVDLIVTDSPFGVELKDNLHFNDGLKYVQRNLSDWMEEMYRVLKKNHHIYLYVPTLLLNLFLTEFKRLFVLMNILTANTYTINTFMKNNFGFESQFILYGTKGQDPNYEMDEEERKKAKYDCRKLNKVNWIEASEVWQNDSRNPDPKRYTYQYPNIFPLKYKANIKTNEHKKREHPTEKNPIIIRNLIKLSSDRDEFVLDPFCGSGIIPLCALHLNRKAMGCEILEKYYSRCIKRLKDFQSTRRLDYYIKKRKRESLREFL